MAASKSAESGEGPPRIPDARNYSESGKMPSRTAHSHREHLVQPRTCDQNSLTYRTTSMRAGPGVAIPLAKRSLNASIVVTRAPGTPIERARPTQSRSARTGTRVQSSCGGTDRQVENIKDHPDRW